jgi:ketosteroid isomerase-like protein
MTRLRHENHPARGTAETIAAFNDAFNSHSTDALAPLLTEDCLFDGTTPPDGERHTGSDQVLSAFDTIFRGAVDGRFSTEELIVAGDRAVVLWRYNWIDHDGQAGHVRGVDVFRVRHGRVCEKLAYVKG